MSHNDPAPLRVFLPVSKTCGQVAGVPTLVRSLHALKGLATDAVLFWGDGRSSLRPWKSQFKGMRLQWADDGIPPESFVEGRSSLLVLSPDGFAETQGLVDLQRRAHASSRPVRWVHRGKTVAACYPAGAEWTRFPPEALLDPPESDAVEASDGLWWPTGSAEEVGRAQKALYGRLPQPNDGYIAQFDRRISIGLSKLLVETPVTPNQITTAALVLGLLGAWLLSTAVHGWQVLGGVILWVCVILDGCDGEVARLKLLASPAGGRYDVIVDNIVHIAIFFGIAAAMRREDPAADIWLPMAVLLSGFAACGFTVWWLVLRHPKERRGEAEVLVDKLSSRDFIYLILALAVARKLGWFLWAAAVGSHVVNLAFWWVCREKPRKDS